MTSTRSDQVRTEARAALEKYDYYVLGVCAAACAYGVERWKPEVIGVNASTIHAGAIVLLFIAVVAAMCRLHWGIEQKFANSEQLYAQESQQALNDPAAAKRADSDSAHAEAASTQKELWRQAFRMVEGAATQKASDFATKGRTTQIVRDVALLAGVVLLAASKYATTTCCSVNQPAHPANRSDASQVASPL